MPAQGSTSSIPARFWPKVNKHSGHWYQGTECWEWVAYRGKDGYGRFGINYRIHRAHRVAYQLTYGLILPGMEVLHHCDNPRCVRPDHLFVGTKCDNMRDCAAKGRSSFQSEQRAQWQQERGERHHAAKLTEQDVKTIRAKFTAGIRYPVLAAEYGVSRGTIGDIVTRRTWTHVP